MRQASPLARAVSAALVVLVFSASVAARPAGTTPTAAEAMSPSQPPEQIRQLRIKSETIWTHPVDASGNLGEGYRTTYVAYDPDGNVIEQTSYNPDGTVAQRLLNNYDERGFLLEATSQGQAEFENSRTVFAYDGERMAESTSYSTDGDVLVEVEYQYDSGDRLTATLTEYPGLGMSQRIEIEHDDSQDAVRVTGYDSQGRVLAQSETLQDTEGRPIQSTAFLPDGSIASVMSYTYDSDGALLSMLVEDADGNTLQTVESVYDSEGRQTESTYSDLAAGLEHRFEFEYDEDGAVTVERTYNRLDEPVSEMRHVYEYYDDE